MSSRSWLVAVAAAATMVGCGVQPTAPIYAGLAPGRLTSSGPYVYFVVDDVPRPLPVVTSERPDESSGPSASAVPAPGPTPDALSIALTGLALGPTAKQRAAGVRTDLPAGIQIGIRSRVSTAVVVTVGAGIDRFGRYGMTQIACTVARATARLASGDKQIPPRWQYPKDITIVTPDGARHAGPSCAKYLNAPPYATGP